MRTRIVWAERAWLVLIALLVLAAVQPAVAHEGPAGEPAFADGTPMQVRPWSNDPDKFHFAILGDRTGGTPEEWPVFDRAVEEINLLQPDFVIMVGDMIYGYVEEEVDVSSQWDDFWSHAEKLEVPFIYLPGNHDIFSKETLEFWRKHNGRTFYSFDYKDCHFVALNTEETWEDGSDVGDPLGEAQFQWALEDLSKSEDARHTFVFMHKPLWRDEGDETTHRHHAISPGWEKIEEALQGRPYTVFAGHYHRTVFEPRNDARYIVLSATKGEKVRGENPSPQMGNFAHFTQVTVNDDDAHIALIEPGSIWPGDIAPFDVIRAASTVLKVEPGMPKELGTDDGRAYLNTIINNQLEEPVEMTVFWPDFESYGWQIDEEALPETVSKLEGGVTLSEELGKVEPAYTVTVPANESSTITWTLDTPDDKVTPTPRVGHRAMYQGYELLATVGNIPLYPEDVLRYPDAWMVAGPWDAPSLPRSLPENPKEETPYLFEQRGPEDGYEEGETFASDGSQISWQKKETVYEDGPGFVNVGALFPAAFDDIAYGSVAVHSPKAQRVYGCFRVDDYGVVYLNGEMIENGLIRTRRDPQWLAFDFKEGWNTVTVMNATISGGWTFWLSFADPDETLSFAPYPQD
jgi:hypothetical protein